MTRQSKKGASENPPNVGSNDTVPKNTKFHLIRYGTWGFYVVFAILVVFQLAIPVPQLQQREFAPYHLCFQQGSNICGKFENVGTDAYFDIPLYLTAVDRSSIVQYHEVRMYSSGGYISESLAKGLESASVKYTGSLPFGDTATGTTFFFSGLDLALSPTGSLLKVGNSSAIVADKPLPVKWQFEGDYYPTVVLNYQNFTSVSYSFPDAQIHVQSDAEFSTSVIEYQVLLLAIGAIVPAAHEGIHKLRKDE